MEFADMAFTGRHLKEIESLSSVGRDYSNPQLAFAFGNPPVEARKPDDSRPSFLEYGMMLARTAALRATCLRAKVGTVILDERHRVVSMGYNGSPPGFPHCTDSDCGCLMFGHHCARCRHSELNALLQCDFKPPPGSLLFCTHLPCHTCSHLISACGIGIVYFDNEYGGVENGPKILEEATGMIFRKFCAPTLGDRQPGDWTR